MLNHTPDPPYPDDDPILAHLDALHDAVVLLGWLLAVVGLVALALIARL